MVLDLPKRRRGDGASKARGKLKKRKKFQTSERILDKQKFQKKKFSYRIYVVVTTKVRQDRTEEKEGNKRCARLGEGERKNRGTGNKEDSMSYWRKKFYGKALIKKEETAKMTRRIKSKID